METNMADENRRPYEVVDIPVCYGGEYGPDLDEVARKNHLSPLDVVKIHSGQDYLIYAIGFAPGSRMSEESRSKSQPLGERRPGCKYLPGPLESPGRKPASIPLKRRAAGKLSAGRRLFCFVPVPSRQRC